MTHGHEQEALRAARNQTLYREVNEKIVELNKTFSDLLDAGGTWVCECFDPDCTEPMELTLGEYEQLRAHPNRFAVRPGHIDERVERVVEEHEHYVVVAKLGVGEAYAISHDPRVNGGASIDAADDPE
jgi:hypothetical protein